MDYKKYLRTVWDFPKKGIEFWDITTLIKNPALFCAAIEEMASSLDGIEVDCILAPEARGFIVGSALAFELKTGFIPARKPGKLPAKTISLSYELEYGQNTLEVHEDAIQKGMNIVIIDDLLATGGTVSALASMVEQREAKVAAIRFMIEIEELRGMEFFSKYDASSLIKV